MGGHRNALTTLLTGTLIAVASAAPAGAAVPTASLETAAGPVTLFGHTHQRAAPSQRALQLPSLPGVTPSGWCGTERHYAAGEAYSAHPDTTATNASLPSYQVIYVYPRGGTDRFAAWAPSLQANARLIQGGFASVPGSQKSLRFLQGTSCGSGYLDMISVELNGPASDYSSSGATWAGPVSTELQARGLNPWAASHTGVPRNYLFFTDQINDPSRPITDQGFARYGQEPGLGDAESTDASTNVNNQGANIAMVAVASTVNPPANGAAFRPSYAFEHEILHTLGAVQPGAPHSSGTVVYGDGVARPAAHCWDSWDVMCYNDGGSMILGRVASTGGPANGATATCARLSTDIDTQLEAPIDCGTDDYFNPNGSIIATSGIHAGHPIWNAYSSRFLCPESLLGGCADDTAGGAPGQVGGLSAAPGRSLNDTSFTPVSGWGSDRVFASYADYLTAFAKAMAAPVTSIGTGDNHQTTGPGQDPGSSRPGATSVSLLRPSPGARVSIKGFTVSVRMNGQHSLGIYLDSRRLARRATTARTISVRVKRGLRRGTHNLTALVGSADGHQADQTIRITVR